MMIALTAAAPRIGATDPTRPRDRDDSSRRTVCPRHQALTIKSSVATLAALKISRIQIPFAFSASGTKILLRVVRGGWCAMAKFSCSRRPVDRHPARSFLGRQTTRKSGSQSGLFNMNFGGTPGQQNPATAAAGANAAASPGGTTATSGTTAGTGNAGTTARPTYLRHHGNDRLRHDGQRAALGRAQAYSARQARAPPARPQVRLALCFLLPQAAHSREGAAVAIIGVASLNKKKGFTNSTRSPLTTSGCSFTIPPRTAANCCADRIIRRHSSARSGTSRGNLARWHTRRSRTWRDQEFRARSGLRSGYDGNIFADLRGRLPRHGTAIRQHRSDNAVDALRTQSDFRRFQRERPASSS